VNPRIVRGLDYYTRTVFEFVSSDVGAQGTVCAGGRYDGLVGQMGGQSLPSLGFALGIERLLMLMKAADAAFPGDFPCEVYIAPIGEDAHRRATVLCAGLRGAGVHAQTDLSGRSVKAQMKYAAKLGARFALVLGEDELATGSAVLRNMETGENTVCALDNLPAALAEISC
jgi:histidyl-tRNA synthetase